MDGLRPEGAPSSPLLWYSKGGPPMGDRIRTIWSGYGGCPMGIRVPGGHPPLLIILRGPSIRTAGMDPGALPSGSHGSSGPDGGSLWDPIAPGGRPPYTDK